MLRIPIRDPDPGWKKNSDLGFGMSISDLLLEIFISVFVLKIIEFLDADPGSRINIPDPQHCPEILSRGKKSTGSRIRICNTAMKWCLRGVAGSQQYHTYLSSGICLCVFHLHILTVRHQYCTVVPSTYAFVPMSLSANSHSLIMLPKLKYLNIFFESKLSPGNCMITVFN